MAIRMIFALLLVVCMTAVVGAQGGGVIQQPTFGFTTVTTTVTAPDGGTINLGGVMRASSGRTERGVPILGKLPYAGRLFGNRGIGQDMSSSMMSVTPRIIILEEEEAKLGLPDYSSGAPAGGVLGAHFNRNYTQPSRPLNENDVRALRISQHVATNVQPQNFEAVEPAGPSPEEIQRRNEVAAAERESEAYKFFEKAQTAEAAGKLNVAKIYYNMAAKRATGELKEAVAERLSAIAGQ